MAKKTTDKNNILSLEEEFLKVMGGGDDFSSLIESSQSLKDSGAESAAKEAVAPELKRIKPVIAGENGFSECNIELSLSEDGMIAHMTGIRAHSFSSESIVKWLEKEGIVQGINFDSIVQIVSILKQEGSWTGKIIAARGELPVAREILSFPFIKPIDLDDKNKGWLVDGQELSFDGLIDLFKKKEMPGEGEIAKIKVRPVKFGEVLAIIKGKQEPAPGFDVFGKTIPVAEPIPVPGKNIKRNDKTNYYEATIFGYLCIDDDEFSVISPVKVTLDGMAAYFINCPHQGVLKEPTVESIYSGLREKGVIDEYVYPIIVEKLCAGLKEDRVATPLVKIASGFFPVKGRDAKILLAIDMEKKAGVVKENDSIDLRERNIVSSVAEGDLLATKFLASQGKPGVTVLGKKIAQQASVDVETTVIGQVFKKKLPGRIEYFAKTTGNISFCNNILKLTDVFRVDGNVDYSTGNIEVVTGLVVTESILPGFKIVAGGDTLIGGTVENGAHVLVKGNLKVAKGIIGANTRVIVMGSLQVGFVQDAEIMVKGDVQIGSYSFNGTIRSGGEIIVNDPVSQKGGKVVGGVVCATKGISMSTLGSSANTNTLAAIQRDVELMAALKKVKIEIQNCTGTIMKIMRSLHLGSADLGLIKKLILKTPSPKKEMLVKVLVNMNNLIKKRSALFEKEKEVTRKIQGVLEKARISIKKETFLGNQIRIGECQVIIDRDLVGPAVFMLKDNGIIMK